MGDRFYFQQKQRYGKMTTAQNYTDDMVSKMVEAYNANPTRETVDSLAEQFGKTARSIIGKLSSEGIYKKADKITKNGKPQVTKAQWVTRIEDLISEDLTGLEKAPKLTLEKLFNALDG